MKRVEVTEFAVVRRLALDQRQRDGMVSCGGDLSVAPEPGTDQYWTLRAGCHVGTVVVPGMEVRIHPKLSIARLFVMLSAASDAIRWDEQSVGLAASQSIEDVLAIALLESISSGLRQGLLRGYVQVEEEALVVRGRIDLAETIRRRPASLLPLVQTPEFLEENIPENRVLATALALLARHVKSSSVRARILDAQRAFGDVGLLPAGGTIPRLVRNRLNARWWGAIQLAILVLRSSGLDLPDGRFSTSSFLVDMNVVFERFVYRALADELATAGHDLHHNRGGVYLDDGQHHALRPDLSIWRGARCGFIGDCKYKRADQAIAHRDDLYQCLAYAAATGLSRVMLFYGGDVDGNRDVRIVGGSTVIQVRTINLAAATSVLRARFRALADEIAREAALVPVPFAAPTETPRLTI